MSIQDIKTKDLGLWIVSVSSYAGNGRLLQFRWTLMPPAVFGVLRALAYQAARALGLSLDVHCINERVETGEKYIDKILINNNYGKKLVFLSVKTFELPRAIDIARQLKRSGVEVVMGGAGVTLADWKTYDMLVKESIVFNVGEGEKTTAQIIQDAVQGQLKRMYWQKDYVNLREAPLPSIPDIQGDGYKQTVSKMAGIDTSEGCPHNCSFCCVTVLRGRKMVKERSRDPKCVIEWIKRVHNMGLRIMLLDDNFRRSPIYKELVGMLIKLNQELKGKLYVFAQLDAMPNIVEEAPILAKAGVRQVFLGIETLDPDILAAEGKGHNKPESYHKIVEAFHKHGILIHAGWMVGFPRQSSDAILKEAKIMSRIFDVTSLFRVVPAPGTKDFHQAVSEEEIIDWDPNNYDSISFVRKLRGMSITEAKKAALKASRISQSIRCMLSGPPGLRWRKFKDILYTRFIAEWGRLKIGRPFHAIMDGIPRIKASTVWRPKNSFKGFSLTTEDLAKRELFLTKFAVG